MIDVSVGNHDLLHLELMFFNDGKNVFNVIARIDNHSLASALIANHRAIALQRPNGKDFVNHEPIVEVILQKGSHELRAASVEQPKHSQLVVRSCLKMLPRSAPSDSDPRGTEAAPQYSRRDRAPRDPSGRTARCLAGSPAGSRHRKHRSAHAFCARTPRSS